MGVPFSAVRTARKISTLVLLFISPGLPSPASSTRSAATPGSLCSNSVDADLPLMSPRAMRSLIACFAALSSSCVAAGSFPPSCTPTTTQPLRCFSGMPCFMLNSTCCSFKWEIPGSMSDYPQTHRIKSKPIRSGVFHRAMVGEFTSNGMLVFAVLLGIVVVTQLIRLLSDAVSGRIAVDGVLALLGFSAMNYLPVLLSISLFISILLTLSRSYRDSEMVVWFCSGIGLTRWIRPVLWYAAPGVAVIALLSLILTPWALHKADKYRSKLERREDVTSATPGMFRESKQADRVYFIENVDAGSNHIGNVFVPSEPNGKAGH